MTQPRRGREHRARSTGAQALRDRRLALGMTLKAAAPRLGISWQRLGCLETDHHAISAARLAQLLAAYDALGLDR